MADAKPGAVGHSPAGKGWRALAAQSDEDAPWLVRPEPPQRPLGAVPLRRLPHPLPAARPLRLVAVGALRRRRPVAGGRHPVGDGPPGFGAPGTGHPPRPPGRPDRPGPHRRRRGPDRPGRDGPGARPLEPTDVVDPRWRGPRERPYGRRGQRHRPRRRPPAGGPGLRRADHGRHLPVGAHPSGCGLLRQRRGHRRGGGRAARPPRPPARLPPQPAGQLGRARDRRRAPRPPAAGPQRAALAQRPGADLDPRPRPPEPAPDPGGLLPDGSVVAPRTRPPPGPRPGPAGAPVGVRRHPLRRVHRPARCHHPAPAGAAARRPRVPAAAGQRGGRRPHRHGRAGPPGPRPGHPPGPAPGLAGGRGAAVGHHRPAPHRRRRHRGVGGRPGGADPAADPPARLPGRLGLVVAPLRAHRPRRGGGGDHPAHHGVHRALHPHRP